MFQCDFYAFFSPNQLIGGGNAGELPRHKSRSFIIILPFEQLKKKTCKEELSAGAT